MLRPSPFRLHLALSLAALAAVLYLNSGTLAPYAATLARPVVDPECGYLTNTDHEMFVSVFRMLSGEPRVTWEKSWMLRRVLLTALSFPFMKAFGFILGGFLANLFFHLGALWAFAVFAKKQFGEKAAIAGCWLLATFPGAAYFGALPYCYAAIFPASVFLAILAFKLDQSRSRPRILALSLAMGTLFLAYDLAFFFAPTAILLLVRRKNPDWLAAASCAAAIGLPTLLWQAVLHLALGVPDANPNTEIYGNILSSFLPPWNFAAWLRILPELPFVFLTNFLFGTFVFLPACFALFVVLDKAGTVKADRAGFGRVGGFLLLSVAAVFLINNAAPPYKGWLIRGHWIARVYEPVFIAYALFILKCFQAIRPDRVLKNGLAASAIVLTVAGNAFVCLGPVLKDPGNVTGFIYIRFYVHALRTSYLHTNLSLHGRRPLGFCRKPVPPDFPRRIPEH